jgi:hypothetical protein
VLLSIQAGLLAWSAAQQSPTFDEPAHLAAGLGHWECQRFDLNVGNPPLVGMLGALPVMAADSPTDWSRALDSGNFRDEFMRANGARTFWLITLARWALIPLTLAGGYVSYRWASELFGYGGGLVTLTLWCFSPSFLAYGSLLTGDMPATALGIIAFYGFWKWLSRPTPDQAAVAGVLLGLAELAKFVWVFLFLLWPALWIAWRWISRDDAKRRSFAREAGQGLLMLAMALFVVNLGFAFEKPWTPPGPSEAASRPVGTMAGAEPTGERFPQWAAAGLPLSCCLPLPESYVRGIGAVSRKRAAKPRCYLRGQTRLGGWWYYYPYALAIKLPLGTLALLGLATIMIAGRRRDPARWRTELLLLIVPFLVVLCFVTLSGTAQRLRYVLPALPFAFVWAGSVGRAFSGRSRALAILVTCCLTSAAASSLWIYPHSLSYFNALVGGPEHGHEHLSDANIDWGQGLGYLKAWYDRHPQARPFHLAYFGTVDPRWAGIEFSLPPSAVQDFASKTETSARGPGPQPGWHAVSVNLFCCGPGRVRDGQGGFQRAGAADFSYFRRFDPVAMAGYCIYIYHVDCAEANEVRRQLGVQALNCKDALE